MEDGPPEVIAINVSDVVGVSLVEPGICRLGIEGSPAGGVQTTRSCRCAYSIPRGGRSRRSPRQPWTLL